MGLISEYERKYRQLLHVCYLYTVTFISLDPSVRLYQDRPFSLSPPYFRMIKVARKSSAAIATSTGRGYHREGTSVNRSPSVTHAMVVHFPARITLSLSGEETPLVRRLDKAPLPCDFDDVVRPSDDGGSKRSKTVCLAISGGLVSVLELVEPLWQFEKEPVKRREVLRMARTPRWWGVGGKKKGGAAKRVRGSLAAKTDDHETIEGHGNRAGFVVMSEGGWLGWYHGFYGTFDVRMNHMLVQGTVSKL